MKRFLPLVALAVVGCSKAPVAVVPPAPAPAVAGHDEAAHQLAAAHGGVMVEIGDDLLHAEAVFEADGTLRLYLLGKDAKTVAEIDARPVEAFAKPDDTASATRFELTPTPQPGDTAGKTSLLVGKLPVGVAGKAVGVSIPNLRTDAGRFRVGFHSPEASPAHTQMPAKRADAEADKLFGTPGGVYTSADITANGKSTPAEKYKGIRAKHDAEPKPGEKVCPISETLANPQFTWVIGGKTYEFCCTPCIEEFVAKAKEKPAEVKPPDEYRQK
jgi:YHS domain-containing protein